jgi:hypothetical protein
VIVQEMVFLDRNIIHLPLLFLLLQELKDLLISISLNFSTHRAEITSGEMGYPVHLPRPDYVHLF